jgi:F0F1-type ATP synthase delta subunit
VLLKSFEVDGYTYQAYDTDFRLTAKDTKVIEKILANKHKGYVSEVLAVLFKRTDLSKVEHYADAHIKLKAKLIRELKAEVAIPYLVAVADQINKHVQSLNEPTEIVE